MSSTLAKASGENIEEEIQGADMSQNNNQRRNGSGRSRARGSNSSSKSRNTGSTRSTGYQYSNARKNHGRRKGGSHYDFKKIAIGGVLLILAITCIVFLLKGMTGPDMIKEPETEVTSEPETQLQKEVTVDGVSITGMSKAEAREAILKNYPWNMKVTRSGESYSVKNLMSEKVDQLLQEVYSGEARESYTLDTGGLESAIQAEAAEVAALWDKSAKNGSISSYDAANDKFLFTGAETGAAVDQEKLISDITQAIKAKKFDTSIEVSVKTVEPEFNEEAAKEKYKTVSSFTTKTTSNSKRNTNIKLAAQAINGTVLQPGQEFSFNGTVGPRTEAKGYQGAAAYNNGEVVEEIGGGVCQVSSTLYNAVVQAGLKTTVRQSHTYEPSYVTPGTDATISWGGPDYKFVNNSSAAIGIRASYSNQTVTISIYAVPVLADGVKQKLESTKNGEKDPPAPTYEEDPTLEPEVEVIKSAGTRGSSWTTRLVITKNGEVISQEVDHKTNYKGHAPVILRNTSGSVATTEGTLEGEIVPPIESVPAPEGAGDGFTTMPETGKTTESGEPGATTAAPTEAAATSPKPGSTEPTTTSPKPGGTSSTTAAGPATTTGQTTAAPNNSAPGTGSMDDVQMVSPGPS